MSKLEKLKDYIKQFDSAVIAYSGGVDSTFLAKVASEVLGEKLLLVTARSSTYPEFEFKESQDYAKQIGASQRVIVSEELDIEGFANNPPNRCYYCKSELFTKVKEIAEKENFSAVFDGTNYDDKDDFRPGRKAAKEIGVVSPLFDTEFTKDDIRKYSKDYGLPTFNKPAFACLASRFPYGENIDKKKLNRVEASELGMRSLGFAQFRVRSHGDLARVEINPAEMDKAWKMKDNITNICKKSGFTFVAMDTSGYRTGAMNEVLNK